MRQASCRLIHAANDCLFAHQSVPAIICFGQSKHLSGWISLSPARRLPSNIYTRIYIITIPCIVSRHTAGIERFLSSRGRLIRAEPDHPFGALRDHYLQHLRELRGFTASTAAQHDSTLRDFLSRTALSDQTLRTLSATNVENYIRLKSREVTRQTLQHVIAHLSAALTPSSINWKSRTLHV